MLRNPLPANIVHTPYAQYSYPPMHSVHRGYAQHSHNIYKHKYINKINKTPFHGSQYQLI
jgi:hypothetical protein